MEKLSATRIFRCLLLGMMFLIVGLNVQAQYFPPPYNVEAEFTNDVVPIVDIIWEHDTDSVLYFEVRRNGWQMVATTTDHFYTDNPPDFSNYCYTVSAVYNSGNSDPSGPSCTEQQLYPEMEIYPEYLEYNVDTNDSITYFYGVLNVGDAHLWYRSLGFTDTTSPQGFLSIDGWSAGWNAPGGGLLNVPVEMNSTGYGPGTYSQDLVVVGNDPDNPVELIPCIMHVGPNTTIAGTVTDYVSLDSLAGVEVSAATYYTQTDLNGYFSLTLPANMGFVLIFEKMGYETQSEDVITGDAGTVTTLNKSLVPIAQRVPWVIAESDCNDPAPANVYWGLPEIHYEIAYDNNFCEDYFAWEEEHGESALRFTPGGYPARIFGGSFYVGQGVYPEGNWMGANVNVLIYDEGPDGIPGNLLDSVLVTINNYGWVEFWGANVVIDSGDFFLSLKQLNPLPNTPPIGIQFGIAESRSYSKPPGGQFALSVQQNFMIRAYTEHPSDDGVSYYTITRLSDFDPWLGPQFGTHTVLTNTVGTSYIDTEFQYLPEGWYAFAVQPMYSSGFGQLTYSNIMGMDIAREVEFAATDCFGNPIDSLEIIMWGHDYPAARLSNIDSIYTGFECVWKGMYDVDVVSPGYEFYSYDVNIQSDTVLGIVLEQTLYPPQNLTVDTLSCMAYWDIPEDTTLLEQYFIYLDGILLDSTQNTYYNYDSLGYGETFISCVEAIYPCGSSDQVCVEFTSAYVGSGTLLPVSDGFDSGSFGSFWTADDNWLINGQFGNPAPAAEFSWYPVMVNYESTLTSAAINGVYMDSTKQEYTDGQFMLAYDIALEDNGSSGTEFLYVDVWSEGEWTTVAAHDNASGSFDWETFELDITPQAFGEIFYIRFRCAGEESPGIISWFLDNIEIFHFCAPPRNLYAYRIDPETVELNWSSPAGSGNNVSEWLHYDTGINEGNAIGFGGYGVWSVASRWDPVDLQNYGGYGITHIRFFAGASSNASTFSLKIWEGDDAGTLIYSEDLSDVLVGDWNEVELATPVAIDITKELWFGYTTEQFTADDYPAGCDAGPATPEYGDMLTADGVTWESMSLVYGLDYNWNLQAHIGYLTDRDTGEKIKMHDNTIYKPTALPPQLNMVKQVTAVPNKNIKGSRELNGYNVYAAIDGASYSYIDFTQDTTYLYEYQGGGIVDFVVTSVYESCESEYSNEASIWVGIDEHLDENSIQIYPNPATNEVSIRSESELDKLCLLDLSGRIMTCREGIKEKSIDLDVSAYEPGVYLLRINIGKLTYNRKIVIAR